MIGLGMQGEDKLLALKKLDLAYRRFHFSLLSTLMVTVLAVVALWPAVAKDVLLGWLLVMWSVMSVRYIYARRYLKLGHGASIEPEKWRRGFTVGSAAAGLCWGITIFLFPASLHDHTAILLIFLVAGVAAFASLSMATVPSAAAAFLLPALLPMAVWLFISDEHTHYIMAAIALGYLGLMLLLSRQIHNVVQDSLMSAEQNKELSAAVGERDRRMLAFFESAPGCYFTLQRDRNNIFSMPFASQGIRNIFGLKPEEVAESLEPLLALGHRDDMERMLRALDQAAQKMAPCKGEFRIVDQEKGELWVAMQCMPQEVERGIIQWHGVMTDITERKKLEQSLQQREQEFRTLAENAPDPIYRYDRNCRRIYVNSAVERLTGRTVSEMLGKSPVEFVPNPSVDALLAQRTIQQVLDTGKPSELEIEIVTVDGREAVIHNMLVPEFGADGAVQTVLCIGRDITARKRMEAEKSELQQRISNMVENLPGFVYIFRRSPEGAFSFPYASEGLRELTGIAPEAVSEDIAPLFQLIHAEDQAHVMAAIEASAANISSYSSTFRVNTVYGEVWIEATSRPQAQADGSILWYGVMLVVTERKRTEEALKASEARYRDNCNLLDSVLESASDVIVFALDRNYRYIAFNSGHKKTMQAIWGKEITLGMSMLEVIGSHDDAKAAKQGFDRALAGESFVQEEAYGDERLSRQYWQNHWAPIRSDAGEIIGLTCYVIDIAERKRSQEKLELLTHALNQADPAFILEDRRVVYANESTCRVLGYSEEEIIGMEVRDIDPHVLPEQAAQLMQALAERGFYMFESRHKTKDGRTFPVEVTLTLLNFGGKSRILSLARDISPRKQAESAIEETRNRLQAVLKTIPDLVWLKSAEGVYLACNPTFERFFGAAEADIIGKTDYDFVDAELADFFRAKDKEALDSGRVCINEEWVTFADDNSRALLETRKVPLLDAAGAVIGVLGISRDITERWSMEQVVHQRELEFRALVENAPDTIMRYDRECRRTYVNPVFLKMVGKPAEEMLGYTPTDYSTTPEAYAYKDALQRVLDTGEELEHEYTWQALGDRLVTSLFRIVPEFDAEGNIVSVLAIGRDVTERKKAEGKLVEREAFLDSLFNAIPVPVFYKDSEGRYLGFNKAYESFFGAKSGQLIGKSVFDTHPRELAEIYHAKDAEVFDGKVEMQQYESKIKHSNGTLRDVFFSKAAFFDAQGRVSGLIGAVLDITERKTSEEALRDREAFLRSLMDAIPIPVFYKDKEGRYLGYNKSYEIFSGTTKEQVIGKTIFDFTPREVAEVYEAKDKELYEQGGVQEYEFKLVNAQGELRDAIISKATFTDSQGEVRGLIGTALDITERKRAERGLQEYIEQIMKLNRQLEENARNLEAQTVELEASKEQIQLTEAWYRGILHSAPDGMLVVDERGLITLVNAQLGRMFGYAEGELIGQSIEVLVPPSARGGHEVKRNDFTNASPQGREMMGAVSNLRGCRKDGSEFAVDISLSRLPDVDGGAGVICAAIRDVSERQRLERALAAREQEFRTLVENAPDVVVRYDTECRRTYVNPAWVKVNGLSAEEAIGKAPHELAGRIKPMTAEFEQMLREVMRTKRSGQIDLAWRSETGAPVCFSLSAIPEFDQSGKIVSVLTVARDISERKRMEEALAVREHESRTLVENTPDTIARYNRDCIRIFANPALADSVEGGVRALLGKKPSEVPGGAQSDTYEEKLREVFATGINTEFELTWPDKNGLDICSHIRLTAEFDASGAVATVLAVGRDITELNIFRQKIHQMAFYDTLTSLPNRALFNDRLRQMLTDAEWHGQQAGVMLLDLDRFKAINDSMGHPAGDELLCEAAARLSRCVRAYDTVARMGGDEFAILLPEIRSGDDLGRVANKILAAFNEPFMLEGKEVFVSTSVGVAVYPDDSMDADDLIKQADSAMYFAKRSGRNNFRFYSKDLTASAGERLALESELRRAVERNELELYYQPKVRLDDNGLVGSEALLRWNNPQRGMVPPDRFISIAEDSGLIIEIGEWVLRESCRTACEWNGPDKPLHKVAINLSARQFQSNDLLGMVIGVLKETGCHPEWIELEITESLLLDEQGEVLEVLEAFRDIGISIAIDDFGTGYSALSYLARFPINTLKIDRSFIRTITTDHFRAELVKAILSIARCLGQEVVAEGVETREQAAFLQAHGCQIGQGYLYSKPIPKAAFEKIQQAFAE